MKQIKEKTWTYVQKEIEVDKWQTCDGKKFSSESEAFKHEEKLNKRKSFEDKYKVRYIDPDDYDISVDMGYITSSKLIYIEELNEETKKDLKEYYEYLSYRWKDIKLGWNIFIESEYDSDSCSRWGGYNLNIYNVNEHVNEKIKQLERLKELL